MLWPCRSAAVPPASTSLPPEPSLASLLPSLGLCSGDWTPPTPSAPQGLIAARVWTVSTTAGDLGSGTVNTGGGEPTPKPPAPSTPVATLRAVWGVAVEAPGLALTLLVAGPRARSHHLLV